ncbi:hypothetical protein C4K16_2773 [Pseudomonas chlororaphis subsp. aurantiaca]|nr:hypothetical protein C4K16_2773 [Pseudomonas chlororaphis subsp. aurantiaca]
MSPPLTRRESGASGTRCHPLPPTLTTGPDVAAPYRLFAQLHAT